MLLKIDDRERNQDFFDALDMYGTEKGFEWKIEHLLVGDIMCGNIIIERKEATDFICSIMDGRLREQAAKMCLNYKNRYIIIEGNPFRTESVIHHHAIMGMMTSLLVKHDIKIMFVDNAVQTAYACYSIIHKHLTEETFNPTEHKQAVYKNTDDDIVVAMLLQIPRLPYNKAKAIAEQYEYSFLKLVNNVSIERLLQIEGIGDVIAKRVYNFLKKH